MTIEEALHELKIQSQVLESMILYNKDFEPKNNNTSLENKKNAIDMAIAALEKQIPKKPFQDKDIYGTKYLLCRECSKILSFVGFVARYCPDCGQKIDWSGEDVN